MKKMLVFDMDGTLANLYEVPNWKERLDSRDSTVYTEAEPMYDMVELANLLRQFQEKAWTIAVCSWLAKNSTPDFKREVREAKREWLERMGLPIDEVHLIQYGRTKADATRHHDCFQVLIDDNSKVRDGWHMGTSVDATEDIIPQLEEILKNFF